MRKRCRPRSDFSRQFLVARRHSSSRRPDDDDDDDDWSASTARSDHRSSVPREKAVPSMIRRFVKDDSNDKCRGTAHS